MTTKASSCSMISSEKFNFIQGCPLCPTHFVLRMTLQGLSSRKFAKVFLGAPAANGLCTHLQFNDLQMNLIHFSNLDIEFFSPSSKLVYVFLISSSTFSVRHFSFPRLPPAWGPSGLKNSRTRQTSGPAFKTHLSFSSLPPTYSSIPATPVSTSFSEREPHTFLFFEH